MSSRVKKIILVFLAVALLFGSSRFQRSLNVDRDRLGLTHAATLENAPPLLAFTTVALGGFRGLISNFLWIRANDMQLDDKYFEAAQLANWITDLEPHFPQVWVFLAWNMSYNISIKFPDFSDRWRWMENGLGLLRDRGLVYNPDSVLIYRELGWFFQNKMGYNLDDANVYFKREWAREMIPFFGNGGTNFSAMINPQTALDRTNAYRMRTIYKLDPAYAQSVDEKWGPLDWRLPEAHAIYWGCRGLDQAKEHPDKVKPDDLVQLRRLIYQSLYQAFKHGRYIDNPYNTSGYVLGPNLDLIQRTGDAILSLHDEENDPMQKNGYLKVYRSFLKDAVYLLYVDNRIAEANKWYDILRDKYPDIPILDIADSFPTKMTMDEYAEAKVQEEVGDTSQERTTAVVEGLVNHAYYELALGQQSRFQGMRRLAMKVYENYVSKTGKLASNAQRIQLPPFETIEQSVVDQLLDVKGKVPYAGRAVIRTYLKMPPETAAPAGTASTNDVPATAAGDTSTNTPESK
jgi:hypothetical protein